MTPPTITVKICAGVTTTHKIVCFCSYLLESWFDRFPTTVEPARDMLVGMPSSVSTMASSRGWRSAKSLLVMADFAPDLLAEVKQSGSRCESSREIVLSGMRMPMVEQSGLT